MKTIRALLLTATLASLAVFSGLEAQAQQQEGVVQGIGQALDRTGRSIGRGVVSVFERTQRVVERLEVSGRIYSRLRWEKALTGSRFFVQVRPDGTAILSGSVPSEAALEKARALTINTIGVTRFVDQLQVLEPQIPLEDGPRIPTESLGQPSFDQPIE